jgi:hypothetical protein
MKRLLFGFFFLLFSQSFAQTQTFDIFLVGADVGDLVVTRKLNGTKKYYSVESNTSVMFGTRKDKYLCNIEFNNNILISSSAEHKKNGKMIYYTYVNRYNEAGDKVQTEKGLSTIPGNITYSVYDIFYKQPKEGETIFVERYGKFGNVLNKEDNFYEIEIKGGDTYSYYYESGSLVKMETPSFLGKVKMIKR